MGEDHTQRREYRCFREIAAVGRRGRFFAPTERARALNHLVQKCLSVSQQQSADNVSIDGIPVDIDNTQSERSTPGRPRRNRVNHRGLAGEQPPTNSTVVLKAARWWYIHGKGGTDPAFQ